MRDLVYCSALPVTLCGIWYIVQLYLSHSAESGILFRFTCHPVEIIFMLNCHCARPGKMYLFICRTLRHPVWYTSLPVTLCGRWHDIPSYLWYFARCGKIILLTCYAVRDLVWYSSTVRIWCIIPLYLSHCAGSGMMYPSSDSSHSTWEEWAFLPRELFVNGTFNNRKKRRLSWKIWLILILLIYMMKLEGKPTQKN